MWQTVATATDRNKKCIVPDHLFTFGEGEEMGWGLSNFQRHRILIIHSNQSCYLIRGGMLKSNSEFKKKIKKNYPGPSLENKYFETEKNMIN